mmetsp:Transcript_16268/g.26052  ORF Transcript_16268/g.26052 Transcript_16268/m.26052 type:complete len:80 (-) Transcript_16268:997-1236(-)
MSHMKEASTIIGCKPHHKLHHTQNQLSTPFLSFPPLITILVFLSHKRSKPSHLFLSSSFLLLLLSFALARALAVSDRRS